MNFFCDESVDEPIAERLAKDGHRVIRAWKLTSGISDDAVLSAANESRSILITMDKDFGELVFRLHRIHGGVILVRLAGLTAEQKAEIVSIAVAEHAAEMAGAFSVVTANIVRIRK
jgi:predicted nuclease of predicted toxin-antitoxin system